MRQQKRLESVSRTSDTVLCLWLVLQPGVELHTGQLPCVATLRDDLPLEVLMECECCGVHGPAGKRLARQPPGARRPFPEIIHQNRERQVCRAGPLVAPGEPVRRVKRYVPQRSHSLSLAPVDDHDGDVHTVLQAFTSVDFRHRALLRCASTRHQQTTRSGRHQK